MGKFFCFAFFSRTKLYFLMFFYLQCVTKRSWMIFNILQQLEMGFPFTTQSFCFFFLFGWKLFRFLSCHGVSLNLIEISPFSPLVFLSLFLFCLFTRHLHNAIQSPRRTQKTVYQFTNAFFKLPSEN